MNLSGGYTKDQIQQYSGSVYFEVFTLIKAAAEKKCRKAERKTLSNFDDTQMMLKELKPLI